MYSVVKGRVVKNFQSLVFDTPQEFNCQSEFLFRRPILMRLYSPNWLLRLIAGSVNRIEELDLGRTATNDLPIFNPTR